MPAARPLSTAMLVAALAAALPAAAAGPADIPVKVEKRGETIVIDAELRVPATARDCWNVLTDFDHMAGFLGGVEESRITRRQGNVLEVAQKGKTRFGVLSFGYESLRRVTLAPMSLIRSKGIGGTVKQYESATRLVPERAATRIVYHAETVPGTAAPASLAEGFVRDATARQLGEMREEILRRRNGQRSAAREAGTGSE